MKLGAAALAIVFVAGCGTQDWAFSDTSPGRFDAADDDASATLDASARDEGSGNGADAGSGHCVRDTQCPSNRPHCDPTLERCVQCELDQDCNPGGACDRSHGECVPSCANGQSCPQSAPVCTQQHALCAGCTSDQDCNAVRFGPQCDRQNGECTPECLSDRDCPSSRPRCDRPINRCVRCLADSDCPQGESCAPDSHTCSSASPARDQ
ncbi:MAG TPA: hypothetical protein VIJ48_01425 [Acidimicrobiia bacterium]